VHYKAVFAAGLVQDSQEKVTAFSRVRLGVTVVATAGNKVQVLGGEARLVLEPGQSGWTVSVTTLTKSRGV